MILQSAQRRFIELRVAKHSTIWRDKRDSMGERGTGGISQRIRIQSWLPLRPHQTRLAQQFGGSGITQSITESPVEASDREDYKDSADE